MSDIPNETPDDEEDEVFFEADPELDAAINEGGEQDGLYSLDELLEGDGDDKNP